MLISLTGRLASLMTSFAFVTFLLLVFMLCLTYFGVYGTFQLSTAALGITMSILEKEGWSFSVLIVFVLAILVLITRSHGKMRHPSIFYLWSAFALFMSLGGLADFNNQLGMMLAWFISIPTIGLILSPPNSGKIKWHPFNIVSVSCLSFTLLMLTPLQAYLPFLSGLNVWKNEWGFQRLLGSLQDFELLAEFMVFALILGLRGISTTSIQKIKILYSLQVIASILVGLLSASRSFPLLAIPTLLFWIYTQRRMLKISWAVPLIMSISFIGFSFGKTLISRISASQSDSSFSSRLNRNQVWAIFDANVQNRNPLIGNGPLFPWAKYEIFPHSLYKSILYGGGYLALAIFIALIFRIFLVIRRTHNDQNLWMKWALLFCFLFDQYKVEFTRHANYVVIIAILFAYLASEADFLAEDNEDNAHHMPATSHGIAPNLTI